VEQQAGLALARRPVEQRRRLAARHVGHIARQEDDRRAGAGRMAIGEPRAASAFEIIGGGVHRDQMTQSTVLSWVTACPFARRCSPMIRWSRWIVSLPVVMHQPGTTAWTSAHSPP